MATRQGSNRARPQYPRRLTAWEDGPGGVSATALSATGSGFLGNAVVANLDGITAIRIRGQLDIIGTLATAAGDGFQGALGS